MTRSVCSTMSQWTSSMSTSEYRAVDAESDLPISAAEIAALASQLYAASIRPGPDSPPQSAPVAPRGSVPDTTAATPDGAGRPARQRAGHDGRRLGRADGAGRRGRVLGTRAGAGVDGHLPAGADIVGTRNATPDGACRPPRQRARYDLGAQ